MAHARVPLLDSPVNAPRLFNHSPSCSTLNMTAEEQIEHLTVPLKLALEQLQATQEELQKAQARIAELEKRLASIIAYLRRVMRLPLRLHNNLAERSVRPLVVTRKISGGTRSPKGSETRMGLASLFGTWTAQHLNPFQQSLALLTSSSSLS
jgi:hypothetical protein